MFLPTSTTAAEDRFPGCTGERANSYINLADGIAPTEVDRIGLLYSYLPTKVRKIYKVST